MRTPIRMGKLFLDQYSLLHFSTGVLAYFWRFGFFVSIFAHILFEWIENTEFGMAFINRNLAHIWPGGKPWADSLLNRTGDTTTFALGWLIAEWLDRTGVNRGWY